MTVVLVLAASMIRSRIAALQGGGRKKTAMEATQPTQELTILQARLRDLEAENRSLRASTARSRRGLGRTGLAVVFVLVATLLAPVAVVGTLEAWLVVLLLSNW